MSLQMLLANRDEEEDGVALCALHSTCLCFSVLQMHSVYVVGWLDCVLRCPRGEGAGRACAPRCDTVRRGGMGSKPRRPGSTRHSCTACCAVQRSRVAGCVCVWLRVPVLSDEGRSEGRMGHRHAAASAAPWPAAALHEESSCYPPSACHASRCRDHYGCWDV